MPPLSAFCSTVPPFLIQIPLKEILISQTWVFTQSSQSGWGPFINSLCKKCVDESFAIVIQKIITSGGMYEQVPTALFIYKWDQLKAKQK